MTKWYKRNKRGACFLKHLKHLESQPLLISAYLPDRGIKLYWSDGRTDYASAAEHGDGRDRFYSYLQFLLNAGYSEIPAAEAIALLL